MLKKLSHPRLLVEKSRVKALGILLLCGLCCAMPFISWTAWGATNAISIILFLIAARLLFNLYKREVISFDKASTGSLAESEIEGMLSALPAGWTVRPSVPLPPLGDADFFVQSPARTSFLIEVKSHAGQVSFDGLQLTRKRRGKSKPFEKDIISQARALAHALQQKYCAGNVVAVVVFTRAKIQCSERRLHEVQLLEKNELLPFLNGHR